MVALTGAAEQEMKQMVKKMKEMDSFVGIPQEMEGGYTSPDDDGTRSDHTPQMWRTTPRKDFTAFDLNISSILLVTDGDLLRADDGEPVRGDTVLNIFCSRQLKRLCDQVAQAEEDLQHLHVNRQAEAEILQDDATLPVPHASRESAMRELLETEA